MRKKINKKTIAYGLCGVQIVLAVIWIALRFFNMLTWQADALAGDLTASKDEILLVLIKLVLLVASAIFMCKKKYWRSAYIITFPFVLQSAFTTGWLAFLFSAIMFVKGIYNRFKDQKKKRWFVCAVVLITFVAYLALTNIADSSKSISASTDTQGTILSATSTETQGTVLSATSTETQGSISALISVPSLSTGLMNNFAIKHFESDYYFWPEEAKEAISYDLIPEMSRNRELAKETIAANGIKDYTLKIAMASILNRKKDTVKTFADNFQNYLFAPFTFIDNCAGFGESITGKRLSVLLGANPRFGMLYAKLGIIIMLLLFVGIMFESYKQKATKRWIAFFLLWSALCALFANTAFDYMLFVPVVILFI